MSVKITLQALNDEVVVKISEISGENVNSCMQCGTCSAVCPMVESMELTSRQVMLLLQHGLYEKLVDSTTPWICASCHTCKVRCPRGVDVPRVMEALRQILLRSNEDQINPRRIPAEKISDLPQIALVSGFRKLTA